MEIDDEWWIEFRVGFEVGKRDAHAVKTRKQLGLRLLGSNSVPDRDDIETLEGAHRLGTRLGFAEEFAKLRGAPEV